jgi:hypothetical protein
MAASGFYLVPDIFAEEEQEIQNRCQNKETGNPFSKNQCVSISEPRQQGEPFDFYGQNEKKVDLEIRKKECEC